jgi:hypothetical protein
MQQTTTPRRPRQSWPRFYLVGLLVAALVGTWGVAPVFAQQSGNLTSIGESDTVLLSSGWQTLAANDQIIYDFTITDVMTDTQSGLATDEALLNVWMNVAPAGSATLELWTFDEFGGLGEGTPLAVGAPLPGATGLVTLQQTLDSAGDYVVRIATTPDTPAQYLLNVTSPGLELPAPPPDNIALTLPVALNVRQGPSTAYPVITTVDQGTVLTVLGRNPLNTWISVQLPDGTQGWVTRTLTDYTGVADLVAVPPLTDSASAGETTTGTGGATTDTGTATNTGTAPNTGTATDTGTPAATDEPLIPGDSESLVNPEAGQSLSNNWRVLQDGAMDLYTFDHSGGDLPVHIWMDVQPPEGAGFGVYDQMTAEAIMAGGDPNEFTAIGRGTPNPTEPGYLFWRGTFEEAGQFYVIVQHGWEGPVNYSIYAAGPGLARGSDE